MASGVPLSPEKQNLLDRAPCGLLQTDADGLILRANRTFCEWVGYQAQELVGKLRLQELLRMGDRIFLQTHWMPLLQLQQSVSEVKVGIVHRDATTIPVVLNAVRTVDDGRIVHELALFVARDRDRYERELVLSRKKLEEAVADATRHEAMAKDRATFAEQMMGIVSHDLRNPLSTIQIGASILARGDLTQMELRVLGRITRATERSSRLIADLLDFTQARLGKGLAISTKSCNVHEAVAASVDEISAVFPHRRVMHLAHGVGQSVADAGRLEQLVGNLVTNALTYGKADASITVTSSIDEQKFSIGVHNEGDPIPADARTDLFRPMTRGRDRAAAGHSVGLGLFIVSEIARAHGGAVSVTSEEHAGTTFLAIFPRRLPA